jgi:hypothetical protein
MLRNGTETHLSHIYSTQLLVMEKKNSDFIFKSGYNKQIRCVSTSPTPSKLVVHTNPQPNNKTKRRDLYTVSNKNKTKDAIKITT